MEEPRASASSRTHFSALLQPEEWAAVLIQSCWRRWRKRRKLLLVTSFASGNMLIKAYTDRLQMLLAGKAVNYRMIDLGTEKFELETWQRGKIPLLFVQGICVGGVEEVQALEDAGLLEAVLLAEFQVKCLMCGAARYEGIHCLFCWRPYLFFVVQEENREVPVLPSVSSPRKRSL